MAAHNLNATTLEHVAQDLTFEAVSLKSRVARQDQTIERMKWLLEVRFVR